MSRIWMNKQDDLSLNWWDSLNDDVKVKLSQKYFGKTGRLSISEIKDIWLEERYNIGFWTHSDTI